jgi:BirA family biotin operon repressor/biotin-[acetyl-CoA-carboxylase] ligase
LQTLYLKEIGSTQTHLKELIKTKKIKLPFAVIADAQTDGVGSRENSWNSEVWIKWPNDFYVKDKKIGGMITNIVGNVLICGLGLNLVTQPQGFAKLDVEVSREDLLKQYFKKIEKKISWKQVFSKYQLEFDKNKKFFTHNKSLRRCNASE